LLFFTFKDKKMDKVKAKKTKVKDIVSMQVVNPYSAGIDVGDKEMVVAIPEGLGEARVRVFGTMTCDLEEISLHLKTYEIDSVAMESTGVYWKPLFRKLIKEGFEVSLVNAAHVKNVTGRKDDENDAMWIQKLHSCGLLKSSYLPDESQEALRTLVRHRKTYVLDSSRFVNRMQKSLELMNVKFHTVISDIVGQTGSAVIEAIIGGERNAVNFLPLIGKGIKADSATIEKSLQGNWLEEHLFTLKENYEMYKIYWSRIAACDKEIEKRLQQYEAASNEGLIEVSAELSKEVGSKTEKKPPKKHAFKNSPRIAVQHYLTRIYGVDVMAIYGINIIGALEIFAETGTDLSKWKNEKHFVSWLNLCPNNKISGGKLISSKLLHRAPNPASLAFRAAANGVQKSDHWLGDYFRRKKAKGGNKYAIIATANKIATIFYTMVRYKEEFKPIELEEYQQKYKLAKINYLERKLNELKQEQPKEAA
jgi:transposase